jgi:uracil phosphoribosyltransferase
MRFRRNMERIGEIAAYEISKTMTFVDHEITTPLGIYNGKEVDQQPVIATILRAGVPLFQGMLNYFDKADSAFIAAYRKHSLTDDSFKINQELYDYGRPAQVHVVVVIACTEGIDAIRHKYPDFTIWAADIDDELTAKGYIVPGLGDAGDLSFGSKMQF